MMNRGVGDGTPVGAVGRATWPQIEPTTLADKVYQIIRGRIINRELVPGTYIREQEVSRATGVSRTPVREALNRLASQEFLERVPHKGFRVPDRSWEVALEMYPLITALEILATELGLPFLNATDLRRLREINRKLSEPGKDASQRVDLNNAFHMVLAERSGNAKLHELLDHLRSQVSTLELWYFSVPENFASSMKDHERYIALLEGCDLAGAVEWLKGHYDVGTKRLREETTRKASNQ
jgi:DNA-binding GntR family transcriptional regulator